MMRSPRPLLAGLIVAAGLAMSSPVVPVAAHTVSLFPAGVVVVPVVGVAGVVVPPVVVPLIGIGTQHRANVNKSWSSTEPAHITIGGE